MTPRLEREETAKMKRADATASDEAPQSLAPDAETEEGAAVDDEI
jgi:hypothetical protein